MSTATWSVNSRCEGHALYDDSGLSYIGSLRTSLNGVVRATRRKDGRRQETGRAGLNAGRRKKNVVEPPATFFVVRRRHDLVDSRDKDVASRVGEFAYESDEVVLGS